MWCPWDEFDRQMACFPRTGLYGSYQNASALNAVTTTSYAGQENMINLSGRYQLGMQNAIKSKLQLAKEYVRDHPCNPGVLDRWMKEKKG